jgi:translation initiation factor IF-3
MDNRGQKVVRLIDSDGSQLGMMSYSEAKEKADEKELDLVLVGENANPPVYRLLDYQKWKYQQAKNATKARPTVVKELKMRYSIAEHDYQVRVSQATRCLNNKDRVKVIINLSGRETQHADLGEALLVRMSKDLQQVAEVSQAPKRDGRRIIMLLSPRTTVKKN